MSYNHILYSKEAGIAKITLNRPEQRNAFSVDMLEGWARALNDAKVDEGVRVIIVTGAGKAFCAGGDVKSLQEGKGFLYKDPGDKGGSSDTINSTTPLEFKNSLWDVIHQIPFIMEGLDKPVMASINGPAMGAGLDMALMCDLRIASDQATFGETYVKLGLVPGDGGAFLLPRLVGLPKALELLWTGDVIDADRALQIGLVNKVVPPGELEQATLEMAKKLAEGPPVTMRLIKRAVYQGLRSDLRAALDAVSSHMAVATSTEDHQEALAAFFEKRKPVFKGR